LFQVTSVWLTAAMLLVQTVCLGLVSGCGCQQMISSCPASEQSSCCCADDTGRALAGCPHCDQSLDDSPLTGEAVMSEGTVCHCGELAPFEPMFPQIPDSPQQVTSLLDWIANGTACVIVDPEMATAPVRSQVPSSEALVRNFKQVVYCVWLT